jgi:GntR family transcriptional regulator
MVRPFRPTTRFRSTTVRARNSRFGGRNAKHLRTAASPIKIQDGRRIPSRVAISCTRCYKTRMIPFRVSFEPGISLYEQVVYAAKKAIVSGQLRPGDQFPSVRELSKALKINPNTAHKVIARLVTEGVLEVHPGIGTLVAEQSNSTAADRGNLLRKELEQLIVEAKRLGLTFDEVNTAVAHHWKRLDGGRNARRSTSKRSLETVPQSSRS